MAAGRIFGVGRVDRHKDTLAVCPALKYKLVVRDHYIVICSVAERVALSAQRDQRFDKCGQLIRLRFLKSRTERIIIVRSLCSFLAPLASVIDTGYAGHPEQKTVRKRNVIFVCQDRCKS